MDWRWIKHWRQRWQLLLRWRRCSWRWWPIVIHIPFWSTDTSIALVLVLNLTSSWISTRRSTHSCIHVWIDFTIQPSDDDDDALDDDDQEFPKSAAINFLLSLLPSRELTGENITLINLNFNKVEQERSDPNTYSFHSNSSFISLLLSFVSSFQSSSSLLSSTNPLPQTKLFTRKLNLQRFTQHGFPSPISPRFPPTTRFECSNAKGNASLLLWSLLDPLCLARHDKR